MAKKKNNKKNEKSPPKQSIEKEAQSVAPAEILEEEQKNDSDIIALSKVIENSDELKDPGQIQQSIDTPAQSEAQELNNEKPNNGSKKKIVSENESGSNEKETDRSDIETRADEKDETNESVPGDGSKEESNGSNDRSQELDEKTRAIPPPRKRLTLQERLAMAAKGKAKKKGVSNSTPPPDTSVPGSPTPSQSPMALSPTISRDRPEETHQISEEKSEISFDEILKLKEHIALLESENHNLNDQITLLRSKPSTASKSNPSSTEWKKEKDELIKKLSEKDHTIDQLMEEGKNLSVKELKLNDSIKKLKTLNNSLEVSLKEYSEKNEELSLQLSELEAVLKDNNINSVNQLLESYSDLNKKLSQSKQDLELELSSNWESKFKEQLKLYNEEVSTSKKLTKEINEIKIQSEMSKRHLNLEIEAKAQVIIDLKQEITTLKQENLDEVTRLEGKIETLRVEIEYSNNSNNNSSSAGKHEDISQSKQTIDYEDFKKLSSNHQNLQQQYLSSQENWNLIESNLLNKIANLQSSIDSIKKTKTKTNQDLKELNESLVSITDSHELLKHKLENMNLENEQLKLSINLKESDLIELQDKSEKLKQIYATERTNLNSKINSLQETINNLKSPGEPAPIDAQEEGLSSIKRFGESGLHINIDPPKFPTRGLSTSSIPETPLSYQASNWNEIRFGESSLTPNINSTNLFMNPNNSLASFNDADESYDNSNDTYSFRNHSNSFNHGSIVGTIPTGMNNSKLQLINKMSSNIRRLEIELNTLKEENSQLVVDKESTERELLEKLKLAGDVDDLRAQIEQLQLQLTQKDESEQTMLELIGEKSEQVEELRADIIDLKDLCKLQVQQMIELQEKKN